jgi:CHASE3 domain sensor protein
MIRKAALQIAAVALLAFIAFNAYLAISHLKQIQSRAALTLESYSLQSTIAGVMQDLMDMESGQRGYLLTEDPAYLLPYTTAKNSIGTHFASLRSSLADRPESERSLEARLESLAGSKQAEMEKTIGLRQQGYRHRAFQLVQTNQGKDDMDQARGILSSLLSMESSRFAGLEKERGAISRKALSETIVANLCMLGFAVFLFLFIRYHGRGLEQTAAQAQRTVALRDSRIETLTSALDHTRTEIAAIEENARLLLEKYGGFLPPVGYECAEHIREAAEQMERLRKDLLGHPDPNVPAKAA